MTALTRLFDLADGRAHKALELVVDEEVISLLQARQAETEPRAGSVVPGGLAEDDLIRLRARVGRLDDNGLYLADVARALIDPDHVAVRERAEQARTRILQHPEPIPGVAELGTRLVSDSYLAGKLGEENRAECLDKLMSIANDVREVATTRKDALIGIRNLVADLPVDVQRQVFGTAKGFAVGDQDGSHLDDQLTGTPHPLSSFKISGGSASLRGEALLLAAASATTPKNMHGFAGRPSVCSPARTPLTFMLRQSRSADLRKASPLMSTPTFWRHTGISMCVKPARCCAYGIPIATGIP